MKHKLIALDLDGTTLNHHGLLSSYTKEVLETAIRAGIHVVIATGRALCALPQDILAIEGLEYAITSNGSSIFRLGSQKLSDSTRIYAQDMPPAIVEAVLRIIESESVTEKGLFPYEAFICGRAYTLSSYYSHPTSYGVPGRMTDYVRRTRTPVNDMPAFIRAHILEIEGMDMIITDANRKLQMIDRLKTIPDLYITGSESYYIELACGNVSKAATLSKLTDMLSISASDVIAFGDSTNDMEMITWAGLGIAMGNASDALKAAADDVTLPNSMDGVACYLSTMSS